MLNYWKMVMVHGGSTIDAHDNLNDKTSKVQRLIMIKSLKLMITMKTSLAHSFQNGSNYEKKQISRMHYY